MARQWPDRLEFGGQPLIEAEGVLAAALPEEGCGLLLGAAEDADWRVTDLWPCRNCWQPESERRRRFAIDPREQLVAQKWARARGWQVLGSLHSHPVSRPEPSAFDGELAVRPCLLVIATPAAAPALPGPPALRGGRSWWMRAWWLGEGSAQTLPDPREIPLLACGVASP